MIYEISDDEDSCEEIPTTVAPIQDLKSKRQRLLKDMFPSTSSEVIYLEQENQKSIIKTKTEIKRTIEGVEINLPVVPYAPQIAIMSKVISAINKEKNCLVESPTGTGKTLALLCAALAWQKRERDRISDLQAKEFVRSHPQLDKSMSNDVINYIKTPVKNGVKPPEELFAKNTFGEKSIYDEPMVEPTTSKVEKREFHDSQDDYDNPEFGFVKIHKRFRSKSIDSAASDEMNVLQLSPEKLIPLENPNPPKVETPEKIRELYGLLENVRCRTSMVVDCSLPVIYYGARTHKQLQQVVKEFSRTVYCGDAQMTILSSRNNSCIREYDSRQWPSRNDMCRECTKTFKTRDKPETGQQETNCKYYDNRKALNYKTLPSAFDLDDLVKTGERLIACPYYAARDMATAANIIFCPYNYLVDPGIRNSMQINLKNNIVIIDEGHNIEDICRDTATFNFTKEELQIAIKELNGAASQRFANEQVISHIEYLLKTLKDWEQWFVNQTPLIDRQPINDNKEAVLSWDVENFVDTLNNHNIGRNNYSSFSDSVSEFCRKLRDDPRTLVGVSQATGTLLESLETVLGFLFRDSGKHMDDFKPVLVRKVKYKREEKGNSGLWRTSQFNKDENNESKLTETESLTLRLICLNPAVIFEGLHAARTIVLASGTLTPIVTLTSELATEFAYIVSPNKHIVPEDRVWVGSLRSGPDGTALVLTSRERRAVGVQDALGLAVLSVCRRAPHGVLCFLPSYAFIATLAARWQTTGLWRELEELKDIVIESTNGQVHDDNMKRYYASAESGGALLLGVYRGKAAEGMDFRDRQARAVIAVGVPFPNKGDIAVKEKMKYNDKYSKQRNLLGGDEWFRVQAYRALNQAVGRCVRHRGDWGAVLLADARFEQSAFKHHLSAWIKRSLEQNHHSFQSLEGPGGLATFLERMSDTDMEISQCKLD